MKQAQYHLKDKRACVFRYFTQKSSAGALISKYHSAGELWCYTQVLYGDLVDTDAVLRNSEKRLFVFNYIPVSSRDLIQYSGNWYEVTRADTTADYNDEVFVYAKDAIAPSPNFILREG